MAEDLTTKEAQLREAEYSYQQLNDAEHLMHQGEFDLETRAQLIATMAVGRAIHVYGERIATALERIAAVQEEAHK